MYLRILEVLAGIIVGFVVTHQIIFPALRGTKVFPWFRKEHKLREEIAEKAQATREKALEEFLEDEDKHFDALDTVPTDHNKE